MSIVIFFGMVFCILVVSFTYLGVVTYKYFELRRQAANSAADISKAAQANFNPKVDSATNK